MPEFKRRASGAPQRGFPKGMAAELKASIEMVMADIEDGMIEELLEGIDVSGNKGKQCR